MLAPWGKSYDKPRQHIKNQRDYSAYKLHIAKAVFFCFSFYSSHIWIWELDYKESWASRIDAFELWCWIRLLRIPWTARRSTQSILKEISPEYSLRCSNWSSKTLATLCKELTRWKRPWCWERLKAGGEGDDRGWDGWMASLTQWTWVWTCFGFGDGQGRLVCCGPWGCRVGHDWEIKLNWYK